MAKQEIFKAYDIRGIYPDGFNEDIAERVGRAFAIMRFSETKKDRITIAVGHDMRASSLPLQDAVIRGLRSQGADVVDIGLVSTPTFYFGVAYFGYDGGLQVSASHNPAAYNGLKIVRDRAMPVGTGTGMEELKAAVHENIFPKAQHEGDLLQNSTVLAEELKAALTHCDKSKIAPMTIVADVANSMGAPYLDALFAELPQVTLHRMYWDLDGTFPNHEADPFKEENLVDVKKAVQEKHADLGIATDGDGDRIFFIDDEGQVIDPAVARGILAKVFLAEKPGSKICYDIRPGRITKDMIEEYGGVPIITKVGHSLIKIQAIKEGAYFAGESSGHFFLNLPYGCFEMPMIMVLKLLMEFSQSGKSVAEYVQPLRKYFHSGEINSEVSDIQEVLKRISEKYHDGKLSFLDGVTVEYDDFWFNVRGSNTEPKIRLNLEAKTKEMMEAKRDEVLAFIREQ